MTSLLGTRSETQSKPIWATLASRWDVRAWASCDYMLEIETLSIVCDHKLELEFNYRLKSTSPCVTYQFNELSTID